MASAAETIWFVDARVSHPVRSLSAVAFRRIPNILCVAGMYLTCAQKERLLMKLYLQLPDFYFYPLFSLGLFHDNTIINHSLEH